MYKKSNIDPLQILFYLIITLAGNWISYLISMFVAMYVKKLDVIPSDIRLFVMLFLVMLPISLAVSLGIIFIYLKNKVPSHYKPDEDKSFMLKNLLFLIAPGEILRFIIYFLSVGDITKTGVFALPASILFEGTYQNWTNRSALITKNQFIFADFAACFVCYAIYFAIYFTCIYFMYKHFWNVGKRERDDLIVHK